MIYLCVTTQTTVQYYKGPVKILRFHTIFIRWSTCVCLSILAQTAKGSEGVTGSHDTHGIVESTIAVSGQYHL